MPARRRVVLLQARDDPRALAHERHCFLEVAGLEPDELECINLVDVPAISWQRLQDADAVLIGGAGSHSVTKSYPFSAALADTVCRIVEENRPLFGSCWGHHVLVQVLGGKVVSEHRVGEVGTFEIELTEAGVRDPLFQGLPRRFPAQLGHHDWVLGPTPGMQELAFSDRCRYQVMRVNGKPVYGTQFHSEMNARHLQARLKMYRETYLSERSAAAELARKLRPSPEVEGLLRRFLNLYV
ncbi:MAG: type 1 glutamine amidotransferase [Thermoanaerobaculia bacterium]